MVKHTQRIRWQFAEEFFECVWPFCGVGDLRVIWVTCIITHSYMHAVWGICLLLEIYVCNCCYSKNTCYLYVTLNLLPVMLQCRTCWFSQKINSLSFSPNTPLKYAKRFSKLQSKISRAWKFFAIFLFF